MLLAKPYYHIIKLKHSLCSFLTPACIFSSPEGLKLRTPPFSVCQSTIKVIVVPIIYKVKKKIKIKKSKQILIIIRFIIPANSSKLMRFPSLSSKSKEIAYGS